MATVSLDEVQVKLPLPPSTCEEPQPKLTLLGGKEKLSEMENLTGEVKFGKQQNYVINDLCTCQETICSEVGK